MTYYQTGQAADFSLISISAASLGWGSEANAHVLWLPWGREFLISMPALGESDKQEKGGRQKVREFKNHSQRLNGNKCNSYIPKPLSSSPLPQMYIHREPFMCRAAQGLKPARTFP